MYIYIYIYIDALHQDSFSRIGKYAYTMTRMYAVIVIRTLIMITQKHCHYIIFAPITSFMTITPNIIFVESPSSLTTALNSRQRSSMKNKYEQSIEPSLMLTAEVLLSEGRCPKRCGKWKLDLICLLTLKCINANTESTFRITFHE